MKTITAGLVLVLVAGCGQATERAYEPRAEPAPAATSAAAEPATTRPASGRPATARVGDLRVRIDWPEEDSALLRVFPAFYIESYEAVIDGGDRYLRHVDPMYRESAIRWVRAFTGKKRAVAGRSRLFRMKVNAVVGRGAEVDICVDESRMQVVDAVTGEPVTPQPTSIRAPYLQRVLARKDDDGVWRIKQIAHGKEGCGR
jgi:hypothetical protein